METSVDKNFFSIDEHEDNNDKHLDSWKMDFSSEDNNFSNVFNLEGEDDKNKKKVRNSSNKLT